jgi:hypothetical protein
MSPTSAVRTVPWIERDGMLRSPRLESLGLVAGFTTRAQGSMAGSVFPLEEQARNRDALARRLGFAGVTRIRQVHRTTAVRVDGPREPWPEADAMWTDRRAVLLGIAAADCVPVLIADPDSGRIGAGHAGWQGTMLGAAAELVAAMIGGGADRARLVAAIGPSIGPCCYAIDRDRAAALRARGLAEHLVERDGAIVFDLWAAHAAQLRASGVGEIELAGICTKSGGHDLWSYRARDAAGRYGTQLAFIGWPG